MEDSDQEFFEISAVARLTGISPHVLRVWERRYQVVDPKRSETKRRQYSQEDIRRLALLKTLVDGGHAIGSVASLTTDQLEERLSNALDAKVSDDYLEEAAPAGICRIAMVGSTIRQAVREASDSTPALRVVGEFSTFEEMLESIRPGAVDLVIIAAATIFPEDVERIQNTVSQLKARRAILVYQFAKEEVIQPLDIRSITALRAPVEATEIQLACIADIQLALRSGNVRATAEALAGESRVTSRPTGDVPERTYSDEDLVRIGRISSVVKCECPQHLANLLSSLAAFEEYSLQCEDRNEADAVLHGYLHRKTAECRAVMEIALSEVLTQEGITI